MDHPMLTVEEPRNAEQMLGYEKFMKDLVTKKWTVSFKHAYNVHHYNAVASISLVEKKEDLGAFIIPVGGVSGSLSIKKGSLNIAANAWWMLVCHSLSPTHRDNMSSPYKASLVVGTMAGYEIDKESRVSSDLYRLMLGEEEDDATSELVARKPNHDAKKYDASTLIQGRRARVVATSILNGQQATTDDSLSIRNLERQKPLLILAEDVYSEVLTTPILNRLRAGIKVTISMDDTVILDGAGLKKSIEEQC
ncbi:hypothetical protein FXO38_12024 [Capsicum annuum]|nr:hypothetical protein FXO38_12024 [Capsicum annuum]